jgi:phospholipid/cholesterol/gamma-HCH transport system substrate-binding protein
MPPARWGWTDVGRKGWIALVATVVVVIATGAAVLLGGRDYKLEVLLPTAVGTHPGGAVMIQGRQVGTITDIGVRNGKALVTVTVNGQNAPLHAGTVARIGWASVVGDRFIELLPGPATNPELPSGRMIVSPIERVEIDDVFAALNGPTRSKVRHLVSQLQQTLAGREQSVNATLKTAGPTVQALGEVMRAVGDDGPAITGLIEHLHNVTGALDRRRGELGKTVGDLGTLTSTAAGQQAALKVTLGELPSTVRQGTDTLHRLPLAVDNTVPLLRDLQPAAARLPSLAPKLKPVLQQLRPTLAQLRPTLQDAQSLLRFTPSFMDSTHATVPGLNQAIASLHPAISFLRPYTPELGGWLTNWDGVWEGQTSGNYARALITSSGSSADVLPGVVPPGLKQDPRPAPGSIADQPWTDANGDGMR